MISHETIYLFAIIIAKFFGKKINFQRLCVQTYYEFFVLQHLPPPQGIQVDQRMH